MPETDRAVAGSREDEAHAGAPRDLLGHSPKPALEGCGVERFADLEVVHERIRPGDDRADAVSLMGLHLVAPQKVLVQIVEEALEEPGRLPLAGADATHQAGPRAVLGRRRPPVQQLVEDPALETRADGDIPVRDAGGLTMVGEDIHIVAILGDAAGDAPELVDRAVHATERSSRPP